MRHKSICSEGAFCNLINFLAAAHFHKNIPTRLEVLNAVHALFLDMLKEYNPNLRGFSTGQIPVLCQNEKKYSKQVACNMAVSAAKSMWVLHKQCRGDVELHYLLCACS